MSAATELMQAGAHAVKLEGARGNEKTVSHLVESGIPVMGHLGLTPQSIHQFGGFKVQAREEAAAQQLIKDARTLQDAGAFAVVLECVPGEIAKEVTSQLAIPTIGIGAGIYCDGQVLVLQDMLGMSRDFHPKFLRTYLGGYSALSEALSNYHKDVLEGRFPDAKESYR
jgi:3-methyl-2-oxobutanoate hydroxymethyltransferase